MAAAFGLMLSAAAADNGLSSNQRLVGHTTTDQIDSQDVGFGQAGTYTVGACYGPTSLAPYAGCRVVGIRLAAACDLGRTKIYLKKCGSSGVTDLVAQNQKIYEGWNNVFFNGDGYEIQAGDRLFYGFDYSETDAMVSADKGGLCVVGENTTDSFTLLMNGNIYTITGGGKLCIAMIVDASSLPANDLAFSYFETGFKYKKRTDSLELFSMLTNTGRDSVANYRMGYRFDDLEAAYVDIEEGISCGDAGTWQITTPLPADLAVGSHTFHAWVDKINGEQVEASGLRARSAEFALYENSVTRSKVYFEAYNSVSSSFATPFNEAVEGVESSYADSMIAVNVYGPSEKLGVADAAYLHSAYAYTVPSFTVNRSYFPGEAHIAYDLNDYLNTLPTMFVQGILEEIVLQDKETPSFASVNLENSWNEASRMLKVKVGGEVLEEARAIYGDVAVTLMLVEDGVLSRFNNVLRGYIGSATGNQISTDGNLYEAEYETEIPAGWKVENLEVVALLTKAGVQTDNFDENYLRQFDVINATSLKAADGAAVGEIAADRSVTVEGYYTLQGVKTSPADLAPGVYIRRLSDGRTDKVVVR